jgi:hypothetical protein
MSNVIDVSATIRREALVMKLSRIFTAACAVLSISLALAMSTNLAAAQEDKPGQSNPGYSPGASAPASEAVDDATLKETANAFVKVREIVQKAQQALSSTSDDTRKQQIAQQAQSEKLTAVKAEGLEPEQYNRVLHLVQADPNLKEKFLSYVQKANNVHNKTM